MTTRKLTPAEALECLRAIENGGNPWDVQDLVERQETLRGMIVRVGIAGIEAAMAESERLREELGQANMRLALWPHSQDHAAAPVPSDEEIVAAIHRWRLFEMWHDKMAAMEHALLLLARRIGVQGVPK